MKTIELTQGQLAKVDDWRYDELNIHKWYALWSNRTKTFYAVRKSNMVNGKRHTIHMHRVITNAPDGIDVDHWDGDTLNNTDGNLRICTVSENQRNRGIPSNNTSGYKGVTWRQRSQKWEAGIMIFGRSLYLGLFIDPVEVARAYDVAAIKYHGEFAGLNFPHEIRKRKKE